MALVGASIDFWGSAGALASLGLRRGQAADKLACAARSRPRDNSDATATDNSDATATVMDGEMVTVTAMDGATVTQR